MTGYRETSMRIIEDQELAFLAQYTQKDLHTLRQRCADLHRKAMEGHSHIHGCISDFWFLQPAVERSPYYSKALGLMDRGKLWLEVGCAMGTDIRKVFLSGWPAERLIGFDITDSYLEIGLELFGDRKLPVKEFWKDMNALKAAYCGKGAISVVYAGRVLHVLTQELCTGLLTDIFTLLEDGGVHFGSAVGQAKPGPWQDGTRYLHSPQSLATLLEQLGYVDIDVREVDKMGFSGHATWAPAIEADFQRWRNQGHDIKLMVFRACKPSV